MIIELKIPDDTTETIAIELLSNGNTLVINPKYIHRKKAKYFLHGSFIYPDKSTWRIRMRNKINRFLKKRNK